MASQNCSKCVAPLPLMEPGAIVTCAFCKTDNRMAGSPLHIALGQMGSKRGQRKLSRRGLVLLLGFVVLMGALPIIATVVIGSFVASTTSGFSTTSGSSGFGAPAGPALVRVADLASMSGQAGWLPIEVNGIVGDLSHFDAVANAAWAEEVAKHWAPDAALYAVYLDGVRVDGTIDLTSTMRGRDADYRFFSPTLRKAAGDMLAVSTTLPKTEFRIQVEDGGASVLFGSQAGQPEPTSEGKLSCGLGSLLEQWKAKGLPPRPTYGIMARVGGHGTWQWSVSTINMGSVSLPRLSGECAL